MNENIKVPEGWKKIRLEEITENTKFAIVDGPFGTQLHADEYVEDGEVPVIRVINLSYEGKFIKNDLVYISKDKANKLIRSRVIPGDIIIAKTGATIGKCGIFPLIFSEGIIASSCIKMSLNKNKASNIFILFWLTSKYGQNAVINSALGTTRTTINITPFKNLELLLPPLPEQHKIAEILEIVDNAIEKTDRIIEKYNRIKQGLMQDLLTKGIDENWHIRNEKTHKFKYSPLGRIPEEWEVMGLGEVVEITMGQSPPSESYNMEGKGMPFLQGKQEFERKHPVEVKYTTKPLKIAFENSILISVRAPVGDVNIADKTYCIGRGLASLRAKKGIKALFLYYLMTFQKSNVEAIGEGSTFQAIARSQIFNFKIPLPLPCEQQRIATVLSQIDQTIEKEQAYKEKLEGIKKGLMEDLLTGKVRVNNLIEEEIKDEIG
jgi:type I restriction enzyme S subunit